MGIRVWRDPRLERIEGEGAGGRWTKIKGQAWRQGGWLHPVLTSSLTAGSVGGLPTWQEMVQNALLLVPS